MASSKVEALFQKYRNLAQIPAAIGGRILGPNIIQSVWSQRNIEKGKTTTYLKTHIIQNETTGITDIIPIDISTESLSSYSPSQKYRAVIRDIENKDAVDQYLEVWQNNNLIRSVDLKHLDIHGKVYTDGEFASFEWTFNESKILYVAERKVPKKESVNKRQKKKEDGNGSSEAWKPEEYRQDWGEQLVGKVSSVLALYDIEKDEVTLPSGVPENVCVAQPIWSPQSNYIIGISYYIEPRKLGLIYCSNRKSTLFKLDLEGNYSELSLKDKSVKCPRFHPDGNKLLWLQSRSGGPHHACMQLAQIDMPINEKSPVTIKIDIVDTVQKIANTDTFYGLYNTSLPKRCWTSNGKLVLSTNQNDTINSYIIDLASDTINELKYTNGSMVVLDLSDDQLLVNCRNFLHQDYLALGKIPLSDDVGQINFKQITPILPVSGLENHAVEYLSLTHDNADSIKNFTATYIGPKTGTNASTPLIVWPHGGPHSAFANNLSMECSFFLSLNYAMLLINYRGSIGAGQKSVEFLNGKVGDTDVADCVLAIKEALGKYSWLDGKRVALVGGSHGGFLVTHLSGQHPEMFKAVVARNPVIDIASMAVVSDIPDWCYVEAGKEYTQVGQPDEALLVKMRKSSPIEHAHKVKAPTLLQIGTKDLRVPPSQGVEYYHRLKANGIKVNMNVYDDNHPLGTVPNEMDNIISTAIWINEHI